VLRLLRTDAVAAGPQGEGDIRERKALNGGFLSQPTSGKFPRSVAVSESDDTTSRERPRVRELAVAIGSR
jgi:hypothetical protein